jgi:hypothetical protein
MKITINGTISKEAIKGILDTQKEKVKIIEDFCKENKLTIFSYKDAELEYSFEKTNKTKVEVRTHD